MKKFFSEFKTFISRGNVLEMAVGIVIGSAFTAIVNSVVNDIIMPIVGLIVGKVNFSALSITVGETSICYGNFIQSVVNFLIVAWVLFVTIKGFNKFKKVEDKPAEPPKPAENIVLLTEIRDLLKEGKAEK